MEMRWLMEKLGIARPPRPETRTTAADFVDRRYDLEKRAAWDRLQYWRSQIAAMKADAEVQRRVEHFRRRGF